MQGLQRCPWGAKEPNATYHDAEWGRPCHNDAKLFEMLILEGMQAGLSWECVLKKREAMRAAFDGFDVHACAAYDAEKLTELLEAPGIIRNRLKLAAIPANAKAFLQVQEEFGSFDAFLWSFVGGVPVVNEYVAPEEIPAETETSRSMSKALKKRGFKFVGPTICYALMQSVGLVDDHLVNCPCHTHNRM